MSTGETNNSRLSDAAICRKYGWGVGTTLVGDEGYGPSVIRITGIGETHIFARTISRNGRAVDEGETNWTLSCRNWKKAGDGN